MHGSTIRILEAAHFSTLQAVSIAEAIDTGIHPIELVTVPILDSRFAQVDARFAQIDMRFAQADGKFTQLELRLLQKMDEKLSGLFWKLLGVVLTATGLIPGAIHYLR